MGDLENTLPSTVTSRVAQSGNELILSRDDAKEAIRIASQNHIAVLGVEIFRILDDGFGTETYSGYDFKFDGDWQDYVSFNNDAALRFMNEHKFNDGYGYLLTSASENEFRRLT